MYNNYKRTLQKPLVWIIMVTMLLQLFGTAMIVPQVSAAENTNELQLYYLKDKNLIKFNKSVTADNIDGLKIQTPASKSYYLKYKTHNSGRADYYPALTSLEDDFAGWHNQPIQLLQIDVCNKSGVAITDVVVMYRVKANGSWLSWVSNTNLSAMQNLKTKYGLDGELDGGDKYAGITGRNIQGVEIRVFEENGSSSGGTTDPGGNTGTEASLSSMQYLKGGSWINFNKSVTADNIDGLKLQTNTNKSYYLNYRTTNSGVGNYYPYVTSIENDYAGLSGRAIQLLQIDVCNKSGVATTDVVVMYRVKANGSWLSWVSNTSLSAMQNLKTKYGLDGELDGGDKYAGITGRNIQGMEIRVFEENGSSSGGTTDPGGNTGAEVSLSSMHYLKNKNLISFNKSVTEDNIDGLKLQTSSSKSYYLKYKTFNSGRADYYDPITSLEDDFAGWHNQPIQLLAIEACNRNGTTSTDVVVMYRVKANGSWLSWVSTAGLSVMQKIKSKYLLDGELDGGDKFAGIKGRNIQGVEIRVFEESATQAPTGKHKIIDAPHIYQTSDYFPTGCESVTATMALQYIGQNMTVEKFVDNYLPTIVQNPSDRAFDPNLVFQGNPRNDSGWGCFAPVIKGSLDKILVGTGYHAEILKDVPLQTLVSKYIDNDIPVITWTTQRMDTPKLAYTWNINGKVIQWIQPQHCQLLVGYDDNNYIFNDPQLGAKTYFSKAKTEIGYKALFSQAVVIVKDNIFYERVYLEEYTNLKMKGDSKQLNAIISPGWTTNKDISWESSDNSVVSVDANGKITAKKYGFAKITATLYNGEKAQCLVTVSLTEKGGSIERTIAENKTNKYTVNGRDYYEYKDDFYGAGKVAGKLVVTNIDGVYREFIVKKETNAVSVPFGTFYDRATISNNVTPANQYETLLNEGWIVPKVDLPNQLVFHHSKTSLASLESRADSYKIAKYYSSLSNANYVGEIILAYLAFVSYNYSVNIFSHEGLNSIAGEWHGSTGIDKFCTEIQAHAELLLRETDRAQTVFLAYVALGRREESFNESASIADLAKNDKNIDKTIMDLFWLNV